MSINKCFVWKKSEKLCHIYIYQDMYSTDLFRLKINKIMPRFTLELVAQFDPGYSPKLVYQMLNNYEPIC